jgi:hypothetical protein
MPSEQEVSVKQEFDLTTLPEVAMDSITYQIEKEDYHVFNGIVTVCCLTLKNGHTVVGYKSVANKENFNRAVGRKLAYDKARGKIFELTAYLQKQVEHNAKTNKAL